MNTLAVISGSGLVSLVITIIVGGLIYWILDWALNYLQLPEPFGKIARVILVLAAVLFLVNALFGIAGHPFIRF